MDTDFLKKMAYMAVGYAAVNPEKIKELTDHLLESGKVTEEEGKKLVEDLVEKSKNFKEGLEERVENLTRDMFEKLHVAHTDQVESLEKEIAALKKRVDKLEKAQK